jgi:tetratricopeptide (TPR) repeat protein
LTVITVALDSAGAAAAGEFIRAAKPTHPSLIDAHYEVARAYNMVNVPTAVWIDEEGRIVRPNEMAFADNRWIEYTKFDMTRYLEAVRDWAQRGAQSPYVLPAKERRRRLTLPTAEHALAAATFRLAEHLHQTGHPEAAVPLFKRAQSLQPESWCFKRQAWALTDAEKFYGTNFQKEVAALAGRPYYTPLDLGG